MESRAAALTVACVALATDALLYGMAVPVLPKLASEQGSEALDIGIMFAVYAGALVAVTPIAGAWIDRRGNRQPLLFGMFGLAAATLLFAFVQEPGTLLLARALQGGAAGIAWTASLALIAATHPPAERGKAMGIALSSFGIGTLLGPPIGGLLADWFDPRVPFLVAFVVAIADGVARWLLVPAQEVTGEGRARLPRGLQGILLVVLLTGTGAALIAFLEPILPLHLFESEDASPGTVGLVFGAAALVAAAAPPFVGMALRAVRPGVAAAAGCLVAAVGLVLIGTLDGVVPIAASLAVVAFGAALVLTPTLTVMADIAESRRPPAYGAVYALYTLAYTAGLAAAPLLAGATAGEFGFQGATRVAAVAAAAAAILIALVNRRTAAAGRSKPAVSQEVP